MRLRIVLQLLRPQQWIKNGFVAAALFFTPALWSLASAGLVALGVVAFCLLSSSIYVLNDIIDYESDRHHPKKRRRPIACEAVSLKVAWVLFAVMMIFGVGVVSALPSYFQWVAAAYWGLQFLYCLVLKHHSIIDVLTIAVGFTLRMEAGAVLIDVTPTPWLIIATGLLALFQGFAKRRDDLAHNLGVSHRRSLKGYNKTFLDVAISVTLGSLLVTYLIYTTDRTVMERLGTRHLFFTAPFVVAGIMRYLQIMLVEEKSGSPTEIMLTDPFMIVAVTSWIGSFVAVVLLH